MDASMKSIAMSYTTGFVRYFAADSSIINQRSPFEHRVGREEHRE